jgi:hypothetical protein
MSDSPIPIYNIDKYVFGIAECLNNVPIVTIAATII